MTSLAPADHLDGKRPRWTPEQAREAGRKSAIVRAEKREAERQYNAAMQRTIEALNREEIGPAALAAALALARAAVMGTIPEPKDALERKRLAETAEILHRIGRLELGESTSNNAHVHVDGDDLAARAAALQAQLDALQPGNSDRALPAK